MTLAVVTATTDFARAWPCLKTLGDVPLVIVANGPRDAAPPDISLLPEGTVWEWTKEYLGTVAAFKRGTDFVLNHLPDSDLIACLHDDLEIHQSGWVEQVVRHFTDTPACGLAGFGGAIGLGDDRIYQMQYEPVQLARKGFRSNLIDAEVHGLRSALREQVACLDGFSLIGRRAFFEGYTANAEAGHPRHEAPWDLLQRIGCVHHAYDSAFGAIAKRYGWQVWYLPVRCRHLGGRTAVGDEGYQVWAQQHIVGGDHGFWIQAHEAVYREFKSELPIRL